MAIFSEIGKLLFGKPPQIKSIPRFTGPQSTLVEQLTQGVQPALGSGLEYLQSLLSGEAPEYADLQSQATDFWENQIIPSLTQRFGMMEQGTGRSSAFKNTLAREGANLASRLGSQGLAMRSQGLNQLIPFLQSGLQPMNMQYQTPATSGLLGLLGQGLQGYMQGGGRLPFGIYG